MGKLTLAFKGRPLEAYQFDAGKIYIGRDPSNAVHIDSLGVAPVHASICFDQDPPLLTHDDEQYILLVNGHKKTEHGLHHGDSIAIGKYSLHFSEEAQTIFTPAPQPTQKEAAAPASPQIKATMQFLSGPNIGRLMSLKRGLTRIGKKESGLAVIAHRKDGYYISHLDGENPVLINGKLLENDSARLNENDIVEIDKIEMQIFLEEELD